MSNKSARKIIENRILDNWTKTPVKFDNVRFTPKKGVPFISVFISEGEPKRVSFGCIQRYYTILIEVRTEKNTSTVLNDEYCDDLIKLFSGFMIGNFSSTKGHTQRVGISKQWYQKNVIISCKLKEGV